MKTFATLALPVALALTGTAQAQHEGHTMPGMTHSMPGMDHPMPAPVKKTVAKKPTAKKPTAKKPAAKKPAATRPAAKKPTARTSGPARKPVAPHAAHAGHAPATAPDPHAGHDTDGQKTDAYAGHDMGAMEGMSHAGHDMGAMDAATHAAHGTDAKQADAHAGHDMGAMHGSASTAPRTPLPAITDADRVAAFPVLASGHAAHDRTPHGYALLDRLEVNDGGGGAWEARAWYGGDVDRAWLRSGGHVDGGRVEDASVELLYGHLVSPWWDVVGGVRQDFGDGPSRTWAAVGVQGLAPYKFEVEATAYIGDGGRTAARLEAEYDTLLSNRLILQWRGEADLYGRDDARRGIGRGLSTVEAGARLRYEVTRRFAPYVGVEVERAFGRTADLRRDDGDAARDTRVVAGLRLWF
ncbi:copper resistance protein B [Lysobacter xanthus]